MHQDSVKAAAADDLPLEISELGQALASLPPEFRPRYELLYARVVESARRRRRILQLVQEALGQLRLDMKYMAFDLEATRRERDEYRRRVEPNSDVG